jgi:hypothetical protein
MKNANDERNKEITFATSDALLLLLLVFDNDDVVD